MAILAAISTGILISALTIRFRDFQYVVPFMIQIGLYATPVAYSSLYIPEKYHLLYYSLNPMAGVVEGFRWCIIGKGDFPSYAFISFGIVIGILFFALSYFRKAERTIADII